LLKHPNIRRRKPLLLNHSPLKKHQLPSLFRNLNLPRQRKLLSKSKSSRRNQRNLKSSLYVEEKMLSRRKTWKMNLCIVCDVGYRGES
jgi:hypothetical protein